MPILTPQAYTCAYGGERIAETVSKIRTLLPGLFPSPADTDLILIGPALINDMTHGMNKADMTAGMYAAITEAAQADSLAWIGVIQDVSWSGFDSTDMLQASQDAANAAIGNGFHVFFVPANGCVPDAGDRCSGGDPHLSLLGNNKFGGCIATYIPEP